MQTRLPLLCGVLGSAFGLLSLISAQALVLDINRTTSTMNPASRPTAITSLGSVALLFADDGRHGSEPWRSDGTALGTALLADLMPGSAGSVLTLTKPVVAGGVCYFVSQLAGTPALWRTDGTTSGTQRLMTFGAPTAFGNWSLTAVGARVYFAVDDGVHGVELWTSDGTVAGTRLVADLTPGAAGSAIHNLVAFRGDVLFVARPGTDTQLWRSDGTALGTALVYDFGPVGYPFEDIGRFAELNNQLYFVGWDAIYGGELWRTDGTAAGTQIVLDIAPGRSPGVTYLSAELVATDRAVFFPANDTVHGYELWSSDGTAAGTTLVADLHPGNASPRSLARLGSAVLFAADDSVHGQEPWFSDGTAAGTRLLRDIHAGSGGSQPQTFVVQGGLAMFAANDGRVGLEPWVTDGTTAGTRLLGDLWPGVDTSSPSALVPFAGGVLFAADDGRVGTELWYSDGTPVGTRLVADIAPAPPAGANLAQMTRWRDRLAFTADDGLFGQEPWLSDGTAVGTVRLADLAVGAAGSTPTLVAPLRDHLLLGAYLPNQGWTLLRSDGTAAGTTPVLVVNATAPQTPAIVFRLLAELGDKLLLAIDDGVHGAEPWITDGTAAGTAMLADLQPGSASSTPRSCRVVDGTAYFFAGLGLVTDVRFYRTDGTAAGTTRLCGGWLGLASSLELVAVPGAVLFTYGDAAHGMELWRSDGTAAGTAMLADLRPGSDGSSPANLVALGGVALFTAENGTAGREVWRSDGTAAGTYMVVDLNGSGGSSPGELTVAGDLALFRATDSTIGAELWRSDGTVAGTRLVRDINPGTASSSPTGLRAVGSGHNIVFQANEPVFGRDLWTSDGTPAGTRLLADLEAGPFDASPSGFVAVGAQVMFMASQANTGQELFAMPLGAVGAPLVEPIGAGCPGSSGRVPTLRCETLPTLGNSSFAIGLFDARADAPVGLHFALAANRTWFGDCAAHLSPPYTSLLGSSDTLGQARFALAVPTSEDLVGLTLHTQATVLDAHLGRAVTLSDALRLVVGR